MIPEFPVYLFDVDGTLVDSAADICGALQTVLSTTSRPDIEHSFLKKYIGYHLNDLFSDLFPEMSSEDKERLLCEYRSVYPARRHSMTHLYPGVLETLSSLPGRKSTATTKGTPTTRIILEQFGLDRYFNHVQGTDGFPCKPNPDVILRSLEVFQVRPQDCLMIGDSAPDMEAGRAAGVRTCGVRYGYGNISEMRNFKPDYWIDDIRELIPLEIAHATQGLSGQAEA